MPVPLDLTGELLAAERDIQAKLGADARFDLDALQAVANIYRAANAVRNWMERDLLDSHGLSWGGFTVLFVLWVWGPRQSHQLAADCDLAKGTLTGVVGTLERRGWVVRTRRPDDRRRVEVALTAGGTETIEEVFPQFHAREQTVTADLDVGDKRELARLLRMVIARAERL